RYAQSAETSGSGYAKGDVENLERLGTRTLLFGELSNVVCVGPSGLLSQRSGERSVPLAFDESALALHDLGTRVEQLAACPLPTFLDELSNYGWGRNLELRG